MYFKKCNIKFCEARCQKLSDNKYYSCSYKSEGRVLHIRKVLLKRLKSLCESSRIFRFFLTNVKLPKFFNSSLTFLFYNWYRFLPRFFIVNTKQYIDAKMKTSYLKMSTFNKICGKFVVTMNLFEVDFTKF